MSTLFASILFIAAATGAALVLVSSFVQLRQALPGLIAGAKQGSERTVRWTILNEDVPASGEQAFTPQANRPLRAQSRRGSAVRVHVRRPLREAA